jgi:hypothetical protein
MCLGKRDNEKYFWTREQTTKTVLTDLIIIEGWSEFLAANPEVRVRFPALPHFLSSSGSGTGSTQPLVRVNVELLERKVTAPV